MKGRISILGCIHGCSRCIQPCPTQPANSQHEEKESTRFHREMGGKLFTKQEDKIEVQWSGV